MTPLPRPRALLPDASHRCDAMARSAPKAWEMDELYGDIADWPEKYLWGPAITHIERQDGQWWAHNEEYATGIRYCPFCGVELDVR